MKKPAFIMLYVLLFGALVILTLGYLDRGAKVDHALNRNEWEAMEKYYRGEAAIRVSYKENLDAYLDGLIHNISGYIGGGVSSFEVSDYLTEAEDTVAHWQTKILGKNGGKFEIEISIPDLEMCGTVRLLDPYFLPESRLTKEEATEKFNTYYLLFTDEQYREDTPATGEESQEAETATSEEQEPRENFLSPQDGVYYIPEGETYVAPKNATGIFIADGKLTGDRFRGMIFDPHSRGIPHGFNGGYFTPDRRVFRLPNDGARKYYLEAGFVLPGFVCPQLQSIVRSKH